MPEAALQTYSDNFLALSHIPRDNSVVQAVGVSGRNVSPTYDPAWARELPHPPPNTHTEPVFMCAGNAEL